MARMLIHEQAQLLLPYFEVPVTLQDLVNITGLSKPALSRRIGILRKTNDVRIVSWKMPGMYAGAKTPIYGLVENDP